MKMRFLSVSEVNNYISKSVKADPILQYVCVYGEVSNAKLSTGGYLFFSLKDTSAKLDCVCFEPELLNIDLKSGMEVELVGSLSFYPKDGSLKLIAREAKTVGIGKAFEKYLELANKLEKEGLFLSSRKQRIKEIPLKIGVITSVVGAVLQDIKNVSSKRYPQCEIIVYPCKVQGEGAAQSVIDGVEYFNSQEIVDTIIIARGGGSYEDLIEFNDEKLAREVFKSKVPVISAIGHETDNTILDLVADLRASTPSMAAELALPSQKQLYSELEVIFDRINKLIDKRIDTGEKEIMNLKRILDANSPLSILNQKEESLINLEKELKYAIYSKVNLKEKEVDGLGQNISLLNPILPYEKGFAIIKKDDVIITTAMKLNKSDEINIKFKDGELKAIVK